jgi:hypothetical protein
MLVPRSPPPIDSPAMISGSVSAAAAIANASTAVAATTPRAIFRRRPRGRWPP